MKEGKDDEMCREVVDIVDFVEVVFVALHSPWSILTHLRAVLENIVPKLSLRSPSS